MSKQIIFPKTFGKKRRARLEELSRLGGFRAEILQMIWHGEPWSAIEEKLATMIARTGEPQKSTQKEGRPHWGQGELAQLVMDVAKLAVQMREENKEQLEEREQRYQSLLHFHPDVIFTLDLDGRCLAINKGGERLTGYRREEVVGQSMLLLIPPEYTDQAIAHFKLAIQGVPQSFDLEIVAKEGERIPVHVTHAPIVLADRIVGIYGFVKDISSLQEKQMALYESEARYRQLVDNVLDAIGILVDERWVYLNKRGFEMFGLDYGQGVLGHSVYHFLPAAQQEKLRKILDIVNRDKQVERLHELVWKNHSGETLLTEVVAIPTVYRNKPAVQLMIRDITERKQYEELLLRSEKLSLVAQLAAGIAHEIRNPLTSLKGFLQLIQSGHGKEIYYDVMSSELARIELILNEMLLLSKPQTCREDCQDLHHILEHVITLLETQAILHQVEIIYRPYPQPLYVHGDENQLKQVFINLLKNAIEAMPEGGQIEINTAANQCKVYISVTDTGCGMSPEIIDKVQQPFFTTKKTGTGLGLMVTYQIIERHKGRIHVESQLNQGTTFTVELPLFKK